MKIAEAVGLTSHHNWGQGAEKRKAEMLKTESTERGSQSRPGCACSDRAEVGFHPIIHNQPIAYLTTMKNRIIVTSVAMSALALSLLLAGCDRQVSSEKNTTVSSDGTVKSKEKTVTKSSDGTVTKTEETKKTEKP